MWLIFDNGLFEISSYHPNVKFVAFARKFTFKQDSMKQVISLLFFLLLLCLVCDSVTAAALEKAILLFIYLFSNCSFMLRCTVNGLHF